MGTLAGLLGIKEYRESRAEREVARARQRLDEAVEAVHAARKALSEYKLLCERRERELYQDLLSRRVHKADFDQVDAEIKHMQEKVPDYEEAIEKAKQVQQAAEKALEDARTQLQIATRNREKFTELVAVEKQEKLAEILVQEDRELEEVPYKGAAARQEAMES